MFDNLEDFEHKGHFFFSPGDSLAQLSKSVPELPGIYYIIALAGGKIELVYIGKSGIINQNGTFKNQLLRKELNNKQDGLKRQAFFESKMQEENIEALDIYWYVTHDDENDMLPSYIEGLLIQSYYQQHGTLPRWNKSY